MNGETVNLIATAPPSNKKRDFHATPERLAAGVLYVSKGTPQNVWALSGREL